MFLNFLLVITKSPLPTYIHFEIFNLYLNTIQKKKNK